MPSKPITERGPVYGVELMSSLPLDGSGLMHQALPSRDDLEQVRKVSERTAAGYEVVLEHYQRAVVAANELEEVKREGVKLYEKWKQATKQLAAAEALLLTACDAWECGQMVTRRDGIVLADYKAACLPRDWYKAAKGGRDE